jgi:UDP-N-acetylmuramyl tripeptide synthase
MKQLSILSTQLMSKGLKLVGRGGSMPGSVGAKIDPNILSKLKFSGPVVLVTGTNGKTSTANMITDLFEKAGYKTISNRKGDNLKAGILTTLLTHANLKGEVSADAVVLEVDELNIRHVLPYIPVSALVVNNFFRDQLDRAKEMETVIESIENVLGDYDQTLILNGNDPNVVRLAYKAPKASALYFGMDQNAYSKEHTSEASEGKFCPICSTRIEYDYYQYSHIGSFHCPNCGFKTPELDVSLKEPNLDEGTFLYNDQSYKNPYEGMYSMYNCAAVFAVAKRFEIPADTAREVFAHAPVPAGRNERFLKGEQAIILNLVKNPTGANEVMKVIEKDTHPKSIIIVLNDNEQDGTDVSWIYDTYFEKLMKPTTTQIITTGLRGADMSLRLYYGGYQGILSQEENIESALKKAMKFDETIYVIATYTALLPSRNAILKEVNA